MNSLLQNRLRMTGFLVCLMALVPPSVCAVSVEPDEMLEASRFVAGVLGGVAPDAEPRPGLEVVANYDAIQKNARFGKPLKLAGELYSHGLFCHAPSRIVVRLPGPGKTFEAKVGLDSNEQTSGGRGSVVFRVEVGAKEAFRSEVLREGMPAAKVSVDLGGAETFVLQVDDSGDGIACDQADWADARITLADGQVHLAGRIARVRRADARGSWQSLLFLHLWGTAVIGTASDVEGRADVEETGRCANPVEHRLYGPEHRPGGALRGDRVPRFPDGGMDRVLQELRHGRHADPRGHPGAGHAIRARALRRVSPAPRGGQRLCGE